MKTSKIKFRIVPNYIRKPKTFTNIEVYGDANDYARKVTMNGVKLMIRQLLKREFKDVYDDGIKFRVNKLAKRLFVDLGYSNNPAVQSKIEQVLKQFQEVYAHYDVITKKRIDYEPLDIVVLFNQSKGKGNRASTPAPTPAPTPPTPTPTPAPTPAPTPTSSQFSAFVLTRNQLEKCYGIDDWQDVCDWDEDMNSLFGSGLLPNEVNELKTKGVVQIQDVDDGTGSVYNTWDLKIEATTLLLYQKYAGYTPDDFKKLMKGLTILSTFYSNIEAERELYKLVIYIHENKIYIP
jgi:hypothetical protein